MKTITIIFKLYVVCSREVQRLLTPMSSKAPNASISDTPLANATIEQLSSASPPEPEPERRMKLSVLLSPPPPQPPLIPAPKIPRQHQQCRPATAATKPTDQRPSLPAPMTLPKFPFLDIPQSSIHKRRSHKARETTAGTNIAFSEKIRESFRNIFIPSMPTCQAARSLLSDRDPRGKVEVVAVCA